MQFSADQLLRSTVYDRSGTKVGQVQQVYLDDATGEPAWVTVRTGFFGTNESLVPLDGARLNEDLLEVPFDKQVIKDAPNYDAGHHLDGSDEGDLYRYYGTTPSESATPGKSGQVRPDRDQDEMTPGERDHPRVGENTRQVDDDYERASSQGSPAHQSSRATPDQDYPRGGTQGDPGQSGGQEQFGEGEPLVQPEPTRQRDQRGEGEPLVQPEPTRQREQLGAVAGDRAQPGEPEVSGPGDKGSERDLIERERQLLDRERDLIDRERELAEHEGSVRPRLRRHNPGGV